LIDNYDGVDDLTYTTEGVWSISGGVFEAQTGGNSTPDHSYASYDLTNSNPHWELSKSKQNEWVGWMDLNYSSGPNGWASNVYNCGMVLAANNQDFDGSSTAGYAVGFRGDNDELVVFCFPQGITGGTGSSDLPPSSTIVVSSGYIHSNEDDGINFYVKLNSDGTWTIKYKTGTQLSDEAAVTPANYSDGSATSSSADETYSGTDYKYSGWIYAHNTGGSEKAFFDNFGIGTIDQSLPVILSGFRAQSVDGSVLLQWTTESEIDNLGFNLYRSLTPEGEFIRLNETIIPGAGNSSSRQIYEYTDKNVIRQLTYWYQLEDVSLGGQATRHVPISVTVDSNPEINKVPSNFELQPCYPNPFNPSTRIVFQLAKASPVAIQIFDLSGRLINTLGDREYPAGIHTLSWDGNDQHDNPVTSGVYLYQMVTGFGNSRIEKMVYLK
jgi:hypothetical protein